jgi:hypothetical protein
MKPQRWVIFAFWLLGSIAISASLWFWGSRDMVDPIDFDLLMPANIYSEADLAIQDLDYGAPRKIALTWPLRYEGREVHGLGFGDGADGFLRSFRSLREP